MQFATTQILGKNNFICIPIYPFKISHCGHGCPYGTLTCESHS